MLIIDHRINTAAQLKAVPKERGAEIDIRDYDGDLVLTHDPLTRGEKLSDWLKGFEHALCIFNVKCDALEERILEMAQAAKVRDYFFLDCANPTLVKLVRQGEKKVAVRFSEFEPIEFALAFKGQADWVWVDCFTRLPLDRKAYDLLKKDFKICLVSPELQKHGRDEIQRYREALKDLPLDAVCTDFPQDWM